MRGLFGFCLFAGCAVFFAAAAVYGDDRSLSAVPPAESFQAQGIEPGAAQLRSAEYEGRMAAASPIPKEFDFAGYNPVTPPEAPTVNEVFPPETTDHHFDTQPAGPLPNYNQAADGKDSLKIITNGGELPADQIIPPIGGGFNPNGYLDEQEASKIFDKLFSDEYTPLALDFLKNFSLIANDLLEDFITDATPDSLVKMVESLSDAELEKMVNEANLLLGKADKLEQKMLALKFQFQNLKAMVNGDLVKPNGDGLSNVLGKIDQRIDALESYIQELRTQKKKLGILYSMCSFEISKRNNFLLQSENNLMI